MSFEVRVNGESVKTVDQQVIGISLMSARGELYKAGISTEGVIDVVIHTVNAGDPPRLDQLEMAQQRFNASLVEGQQTGTPPYEVSREMAARQGSSDVTLRPGGDRPNDQALSLPPSADLSQGLTPADHEILTARINAFNEHGDAQQAVNDNPANGKAQTAEQGAVPESPSTGEASIGTGTETAPDSGFVFATPLAEGVGTPPPESTPEGNLGSGKGPIPGDASQLDAQGAGGDELSPTVDTQTSDTQTPDTQPEPEPNA